MRWVVWFLILYSCVSRYIVTIDAGSSGTRVHIHRYGVSDYNRVLGWHVVPQGSFKLKPGLASLVSDPVRIQSIVTELLEFAQLVVPPEEWDSTSVHLKGTAGFRTLEDNQVDAVLKVCENAIREFFVFSGGSVGIISGQEEAIFGWIAANYLKHGFNEMDATVGVVEMGGASVQISYLGPGEAISMGNIEFELHSRSFLNFGLESILSAVDRSLDDNNPCYPTGFSSGTGDYDACKDIVLKLLKSNRDTCTSLIFPKCDDVSASNPGDLKFIAIENFFYTAEFFDVLDVEAPLQKMEEIGREFCNKPWEVIVQQYASARDPPEELLKYCFSSVYIPMVLDFAGSGEISITKEIQKTDVDWALGFALHHVNNNPTPISVSFPDEL